MSAVCKAIIKLQDIIGDVDAYLTPADLTHSLGAIDHYTKLYNDGGFDQDRRSCQWSIYNDRYGADSILGFAGEVLAIGLWNKQQANTTFCFGSGERDDEKAGMDVVVSNPSWKRPFVAQVKLINDADGHQLRIRQRYIQYDPHKVHRFVLSDITHRKCIVVDYSKFQRKVYNALDDKDVGFIQRDELMSIPHVVSLSL